MPKPSELAYKVALWDAINVYVVSCGGDPGSMRRKDDRMDAVVAVERLVAQARAEERAAKDMAYTERARLIAVLAKMFVSHLTSHPPEDREWEDRWRTVVCIHTPAGQMTWHLHDDHIQFFDGVIGTPYVKGHWDGHTTGEKYERLGMLVREWIEARGKVMEENAAFGSES